MIFRGIQNVLIPVTGQLVVPGRVAFGREIEEVVFTGNPLDWRELRENAAYEQWRQQNLPVAEPGWLDGRGRLLIPGTIDPHVHFDTPGFEFREDFEHGSAAAAAGGVTTVLDMPCTSIPPVTRPDWLQEKLQEIRHRSRVDYGLWGGICGNDFDQNRNVEKQIWELAENGVVGFKTYLMSGMDTFTELTLEQLEKAAQWVRSTGLPLAVHAEYGPLVRRREAHMKQLNRTDWRAYAHSRDERVEAMAIMHLLQIARKTGVRLHVVHLSSEFGLDLIRMAREEGLPVSAETCPHYLYFTQEDFDNPDISAWLKTAPPVKTRFDRDALWHGLADGILSFVTTDHAGCDPDVEKNRNNFWQVYGGIPGVEHRLPFLFSEGLQKGRLDLEQAVALLSGNVADFFGLHPQKGYLKAGGDADLVLVDLWERQVVRSQNMHSKGRYTPFEGVEFSAKVKATFLRGRLIFNDGFFQQPAEGDYPGLWIQP